MNKASSRAYIYKYKTINSCSSETRSQTCICKIIKINILQIQTTARKTQFASYINIDRSAKHITLNLLYTLQIMRIQFVFMFIYPAYSPAFPEPIQLNHNINKEDRFWWVRQCIEAMAVGTLQATNASHLCNIKGERVQVMMF